MPVDQQTEYLRRLAEIDAAVAKARPTTDVVVERAAGMLAGYLATARKLAGEPG